MRLELGYGNGAQAVEIPDRNLLGVLTPNEVKVGLTGEAEARRALANPKGSPRLREIVKKGEKIAVITSDITRPLPTRKIMPALLEELYSAGARPEDITLVFALGSHRRHTPDEIKKLAGAAYDEIRCVDGDANDTVSMGVTKRGTPVDITRAVALADRRICLGNIEYHYFAGYSGGAKAVMPGVSTRTAIQSNHRLMVHSDARAGRLTGNPVREDIEEAGALVGIDFILNAVLDERKEIVYAAAGDAVEAHRDGCAFLDSLYKVPVPARADIVIVSQGGAPKDINLYQTQKALDNAKHAVKKGGVIILAGACGEGMGERVFEEWMTKSPDTRSMIERIKRDFQLGGHKAAAIAMTLEDADIYLVSELEPDFVKSIFLTPQPSVQKALETAFGKLGKDAAVTVMPYGGSTLPVIA